MGWWGWVGCGVWVGGGGFGIYLFFLSGGAGGGGGWGGITRPTSLRSKMPVDSFLFMPPDRKGLKQEQ